MTMNKREKMKMEAREMMIKGYRGSDNYQSFKVGEEYKTEGPVCENGFLVLSENPLDAFSYWPPSGSQYYLVEGSGEIALASQVGWNIDAQRYPYNMEEEEQVLVSNIRIIDTLEIKDLINRGLEYITLNNAVNNGTCFSEIVTNSSNNSAAVITNGKKQTAAVNTGDWSISSNSGEHSVATNTGECSAATNSGEDSISAASGDWSVSINSGDRSLAACTGFRSVTINSGTWSSATNSGIRSTATNSGSRSVAVNTGDESISTNSGYWSISANSGYKSIATNSGNRSAAVNTAYRSTATNTGDRSVAVNTGDESAALVEGKGSIAIAAGYKSAAKGALGSWIVLTEWEKDDNGDYQIVDVRCLKVDGENIKPDTYYRLEGGEIVEVERDPLSARIALKL